MEVHPRLFDVAEVVREVATLMAPRIAEKDQQLDARPAARPAARAGRPGARAPDRDQPGLQRPPVHGRRAGSIAVTAASRGRRASSSRSSDNGRGMTPGGARARLRPLRAPRGRRAAGTGLGLSIVKSLVDLQRRLDRRRRASPGEGTTFTVRLPAEAEAGGRAGAARGDPRQARAGGRRRAGRSRELIAEQLEPFEVETEIAHCGRRGARAPARRALRRDDARHADAGHERLRRAARDPRATSELRRTPVVVVSILSDHEALFGEWKVTKPIDPEELADALGSAVLAGRTRRAGGRAARRCAPRLEPALVRSASTTSGSRARAAAARACQERRFEVALVDAGMRSPRRGDARARPARAPARPRGACSSRPATRRRGRGATSAPSRCRSRTPAPAVLQTLSRARRPTVIGVALARAGDGTVIGQEELQRGGRAPARPSSPSAGRPPRRRSAARALRRRPARDLQGRARRARRSCAPPTWPPCAR